MNRVEALVKPTDHDVLKVMREIIAEDTGSIIWTDHIKSQMIARKISNTQVLRCLEKGTVTEWPVFNAGKGNWKFRMQHVTAGQEIGVALALNLDEKVILISTWGDDRGG